MGYGYPSNAKPRCAWCAASLLSRAPAHGRAQPAAGWPTHPPTRCASRHPELRGNAGSSAKWIPSLSNLRGRISSAVTERRVRARLANSGTKTCCIPDFRLGYGLYVQEMLQNVRPRHAFNTCPARFLNSGILNSGKSLQKDLSLLVLSFVSLVRVFRVSCLSRRVSRASVAAVSTDTDKSETKRTSLNATPISVFSEHTQPVVPTDDGRLGPDGGPAQRRLVPRRPVSATGGALRICCTPLPIWQVQPTGKVRGCQQIRPADTGGAPSVNMLHPTSCVGPRRSLIAPA